jgi:hypothetical protein
MNWSVPKIWEGGDVWIIGGGPSIIKQFDIPLDVVNDVVNRKLSPSLYSSYMESIHSKHIIGINIAYMLGNWVDMVFFGDHNFLELNKNSLYDFPNLKVSCVPKSEKYPWVHCLSKDPTHPFGITTHPMTVSWNKNSGAAAISVAEHTGAKRIFLLGFDMKLLDNKQHYHSQYNNNGEPKNMERLPFNRPLQGFPIIAQDAKQIGIEIINVNPDSGIHNFPKVSLKEALLL